MNQILTECPVCRIGLSEMTAYCRRCGCHLLLLEKIRQEAEKCIMESKINQSTALYTSFKR